MAEGSSGDRRLSVVPITVPRFDAIVLLHLSLEVPDPLTESARDERNLPRPEHEDQKREDEEEFGESETEHGKAGVRGKGAVETIYLRSIFAIVCFCMFEVPS